MPRNKKQIFVPEILAAIAMPVFIALILAATAFWPGSRTFAQNANSTPTVIATLPADGGGGLAVNPTTTRIYALSYNNQSVTVIDGTTNNVVATVPVEWGVNSIAVNPTTNRIYVTRSYYVEDPVYYPVYANQ